MNRKITRITMGVALLIPGTARLKGMILLPPGITPSAGTGTDIRSNELNTKKRTDSMTVIWTDTETTGLDPAKSGPFELAFLVYKGSQLLEEKVFHLNPLNNEVVIHPEALEVNGATEALIRSYPPAKDVVPDMAEFFQRYAPPEKLVFAGYKCPFDYGHIEALLLREKFAMSDYFSGRFIDVLELVKRARGMKLLENTRDNKLETMTKSLGIGHDAAHSALSDIKATRRLYEIIYLKFKRRKA
jgi:DNA polymerase III epsilon subunit-like protein